MVNGNVAAKNIRAKRQAHLKGQIGGRQAKFNSALGKAKAAKAGPSLRDQAAAHRAGKGTRAERLKGVMKRAGNASSALLGKTKGAKPSTPQQKRDLKDLFKRSQVNQGRYSRASSAIRQS